MFCILYSSIFAIGNYKSYTKTQEIIDIALKDDEYNLINSNKILKKASVVIYPSILDLSVMNLFSSYTRDSAISTFNKVNDTLYPQPINSKLSVAFKDLGELNSLPQVKWVFSVKNEVDSVLSRSEGNSEVELGNIEGYSEEYYRMLQHGVSVSLSNSIAVIYLLYLSILISVRSSKLFKQKRRRDLYSSMS